MGMHEFSYLPCTHQGVQRIVFETDSTHIHIHTNMHMYRHTQNVGICSNGFFFSTVAARSIPSGGQVWFLCVILRQATQREIVMGRANLDYSEKIQEHTCFRELAYG